MTSNDASGPARLEEGQRQGDHGFSAPAAAVTPVTPVAAGSSAASGGAGRFGRLVSGAPARLLDGDPPPVDKHREVSEAAARFRVGSNRLDGDVVRVPMRVGPWMAWSGGQPCVGSLGVALDNALGFSVFRVRPPGRGAVTTEISVDVAAPGPWRGEGLVAVGRLLSSDDVGGLAACEVVDDSGAIVVTGTARCQFIPTPRATGAGGDVRSPRSGVEPTAGFGVLDLLGGLMEPGETTARVVVKEPAPLSNGVGTVHGGVLFCLSEMAATALTRPDHDLVVEQTTSVRVNYLRPARIDEPMTAVAEVLHRGRSVTVSRVTTSGTSGKPYTVAVVTRRRASSLATGH
ncbi:MAG: PaaI family thioesterase [Frankia sp.]